MPNIYDMMKVLRKEGVTWTSLLLLPRFLLLHLRKTHTYRQQTIFKVSNLTKNKCIEVLIHDDKHESELHFMISKILTRKD